MRGNRDLGLGLYWRDRGLCAVPVGVHARERESMRAVRTCTVSVNVGCVGTRRMVPVNCLRTTVKDWSWQSSRALPPSPCRLLGFAAARAGVRMPKLSVPRSASIEEMDLFASNSHLEEANGAATTPFGISIKREPDADLEQTAVTKRVRFALPVAPVDEEDVDEDVVQLCGING